jgi:glycosyltransferase involved in cell wall biosynthesis
VKPLRIAVLGVLAVHKGLPLVRELAETARSRGIDADVVLIGYVPGAADAPHGFRATGRYEEAELDALIAREDPDVIWFPVRIPETYSYTLSAALRSQRPLAVPDIGALAERVAGLASTAVYPWRSDAGAILDVLRTVAHMPRAARPPEPASDFYTSDYLRADRPPAYRPSTPPIAAYETRLPGGQYDACAYIRVHLPLHHPRISIAPVVSLRDGEPPANAGGVLVQRTAIADVAFAQRVIALCRERAIPLVYEADDDLFDIGPDHADFAYYDARAAAARLIAESADAIVTSTPALARALRRRNERVVVVENALDERLWYAEPVAAEPPADRETRVLYMGTATHGADIALIRDAVARLRPRNGRPVVLEVIGATSGGDESWYRRLHVPPLAAASYPSFVRWLRSHRERWALGVIPLRANAFNAGKSAIKALDYGAIGLPAIASDFGPYRSLAEAGAPLLALVADTTEAWHAALESALDASAATAATGQAMRAWVRANGTLEATAPARRAALVDVFARPLELRRPG